MRFLYLLGAFSTYIASVVVAHPLCWFDDRPTDPDEVLTFCPAQDEGACCNDLEEAEVEANFDAAGPLSDECSQYYKEWLCGVCASYSGHYYSLLGEELGSSGLIMKGEFCEGLTSACAGEINFPDYDGEGFCAKHAGDTDLYWAYPYIPEDNVFNGELQKAFPDLPVSAYPEQPLSMHMTPDSSQWWVGGQHGQITEMSANDPTSSDLVLDIGSESYFYENYEEGLLDFAFSPVFDSNSFFYVSYTIDTDAGGRQNRLAKFVYSSGDPAATLSSQEVLMDSLGKSTSIHSGGWCGFKPSAYGSAASTHDLYWAIGDGGPQLDTDNRGQDTTNILASIVRISVPSAPGSSGYEIPSGNIPAGGGNKDEICAYGFRNPFRCGFDRETDELYCGDVGHEDIEEIDLIECGGNYGWRRFEGTRCQSAVEDEEGTCDGVDSRTGYTFPVYEYCHADYSSETDTAAYTGGTDICGARNIVGSSVIGGYPYRGQAFEDVLYGALIFGDFNNKNIYYLQKEGDEYVPGTIISDGSAQIVSFAEDNAGEMYMILGDREVYHLPCGDLCASTCLDQAEEVPTYESLGCFGDLNADRALTLDQGANCPDGEEAMSPTICAAYCATVEGAEFFGVEFSYECFCGGAGEDYDKHGSLPDSSCGSLCAGSADMTCGGNNAIEVFAIGNVAPSPVPPPTFVAPTPTPAPAVGGGGGEEDYTLVGCFVDTPDRVLSAATTTSATMTTEVCSENCAEYPYFGTEYGVQCFCGGASSDPDVNGEATCDFECGGDATQTCGGQWAISVYLRDNVTGGDDDDATAGGDDDATAGGDDDATAGGDDDATGGGDDDATTGGDDDATTDYEFIGCIADDKSARVLQSKTTLSDMTTDVCAGLCAGSAYFGTQYGNECWCGDSSSIIDTGSATCDYPCSGAAAETCGGFDALSLYSYGDNTGGGGSGGGGGGDGDSLGCYQDSKASRMMGDMLSSQSMSSGLCAEHCSGAPFYGTQYGEECWCSAADFTLESLDLYEEIDGCDLPCTGDDTEICGGFDAMTVYQS